MPTPSSLYAARDCIQFVFGDNISIIHRDNIFFVGKFTDVENQPIQGEGIVHYPSGLVIEGSIQEGRPHGNVVISCPSCSVTERCTFVNGLRQSTKVHPSLLTFGAGYQIYACVEDLSPIALESVVPYLRNFYHHSYFDLGRPRLELIPDNREGLENSLPPNPTVLWSVTNFDIQQAQMIVDLTSLALTDLANYHNHEFFRNEKNNLLREVTLVCHSLVRKHQLNFMIPEITRFRRINQIVKDSVEKLRDDSLDRNEEDIYKKNWQSVFSVLACSKQLVKLSLVAYPFAKLDMTNNLSVWKSVSMWELKRKLFYFVVDFSLLHIWL